MLPTWYPSYDTHTPSHDIHHMIPMQNHDTHTRSHDTHVSILSWAVRFCRMISTISRCFFMCSSMKADWSEPRWPIRVLVMSSLLICSRSRVKQLLLCFFICSTLSYRRKDMLEVLTRSSKINAPSCYRGCAFTSLHRSNHCHAAILIGNMDGF